MSGLSSHERIAYAGMLRTLPWSGLSEQVFVHSLRGGVASLEKKKLAVEEQERRMALAEATASYKAYCDVLETGAAA